MLKIYQRFFQVVWAINWQYRANFLLSIFYSFVTPTISLSVWVSVARANGSVGGFDQNDFIVYYLLVLLVSVFTNEFVVYMFAWKVQGGQLSSELLLPVHPMLTIILVEKIAHKLMNTLIMLPLFAILLAIFQPQIHVTAGGAALGALAIVLGFCVNFLFGAIIASLAFWTTRVYWIAQLFGFALWRMLSGELVPLPLLPGPIRAIAQVLPYQLGLYFPVQVLTSKATPTELATGFALQVFWIAALFVIFLLQWRAGVRRYSAVGA